MEKDKTGKDINILVVDDEKGPRECLRMALNDRYNVLLAENGKECLQIVKKTRPELVLLDVKMPGLDGIEVLKRIKKIDSSISIVIVTGAGTHQTAVNALKFGALDFIAKPINPKQVREVVKNALTEKAKEPSKKPGKNALTIDEALQKNYLDGLSTLLKVLEARDPYTKEHSKQVTKYAVLIAKELGFSKDQIEIMEQTCMLHDIGKIGINDAILRKPGRLTPEEWEIIRQHPIIGEEILQPLKLLHIEQAMVRHHHERYDGKGYPDGLAGEDIPIYARILAVADSYAAMTSERPYRKALSREDAIAELKRRSGSQFDPKIVETFLKVIK